MIYCVYLRKLIPKFAVVLVGKKRKSALVKRKSLMPSKYRLAALLNRKIQNPAWDSNPACSDRMLSLNHLRPTSASKARSKVKIMLVLENVKRFDLQTKSLSAGTEMVFEKISHFVLRAAAFENRKADFNSSLAFQRGTFEGCFFKEFKKNS